MKRSWPWKGLLHDIVEARGSELQLYSYIAVLAGLRHSLDDWVPASRLERFRHLTSRLGLFVEIDCVFRFMEGETPVLGSNFMPTTRAFGVQYPQGLDDNPSTSIHVIVSSRRDWAAEALASSWYSVAVDGRIVRKPLVDHVRFGEALGYPECCIKFFSENSNFSSLNTPAESAVNSTRFRWQANCLAKHTPWMTIFHMPCSFDCQATCEHVDAVSAAVKEIDPSYLDAVASFARRKFLLINEIVSYALVDATRRESGRISYKRAIHTGYGDLNDRYGNILARGDELEILDGSVFVWKEGRLIESLETHCSRGIMDVPQILSFE
jgi:hypothetical protein